MMLTSKGESAMAWVVEELDKQLVEVKPKLSADEMEQLASGLTVLAHALHPAGHSRR
jgi:hypothetical protein